ncbi:MAG: putative 4-hydroxybenzoate polyprenyltransferase [Fimbriimonadaceae bacterium]|nr:putative 4-hydroxybenzoate polyprenyltransferase [Fimbriimonadaceae bacterium]
MAVAARGWKALQVYLEMIKFEHSVFALPFALTGMVWGSVASGTGGWPGWRVFLWIVVAMVSCRSAAMAYNRIVDRDVDAQNARTKSRAIPAGLLTLRQSSLFFYGSCAVFFLSAAMLNPLALLLSPVALGVTLFYSVTKRFTPLCHFVLGLSLGIAPSAAWIATTGSLALAPFVLTLAVLFWTAGFDIIYALQDDDFDRDAGLRSLPQTLGRRRALAVSRTCHVLAVGLLAWAASLAGASWPLWAGVAFAAALLGYEQSLVKPTDLSRVNMAFFTLNGFVSMGFFGFVLLDRWVGR